MKKFKTIILRNALCCLMLLISPTISFTMNWIKGEIPVTCNSEMALQAFLNGREAFEMNRIEDAWVYFDNAVKLEPNFAMAYLYKSFCYDNETVKRDNLNLALKFSGKSNEGEQILIKMASIDPEKNDGKRMQLAERLVKLYPGNARMDLILASEYHAINDVTKYRDIVRDAIQTDPDSPLAFRALAASYLLDVPMDFKLAEKYMKKFAELRPDEVISSIALGDIYRAQVNIPKAIDEYSKAIKINPNSTLAYIKRGYMNSFSGMSDSAVIDFQTASSLPAANKFQTRYLQTFLYMIPSVSNPEGWNDLACNLTSEEHNPLDEHYFCCSTIALSKGLFAPSFESYNSAKCIERALLRESDLPDENKMKSNFAFVASLRALQGENYVQAALKIKEFGQLTNSLKDPHSSPVYNYLLGLSYLKQKQYNKAIRYYHKSDLTNQCVKFELGLAYDGIGDHVKSKGLLLDVIKSNYPSSSIPWMAKVSEKWINTPVADISQP